MDLRFPHHENEIAQAEAASGKEFARYWMHIGLLTVNGEKMSKSIGNIINVRDLLSSWEPDVVRFFFAQAHYRSPPDFSEKALENSKKGLDRIYRVKEKLEECIAKKEKSSDHENKEFERVISDFKFNFESAMDDDFNTPQAVSSIFDFVNSCNCFFEKVKNPGDNVCKKALDTFIKLGNILTLFQVENKDSDKINDNILKQLRKFASSYIKDFNEKTIEELIDLLLEAREEARKKKDWNIADSIRNNLDKLGFEIQDTADGPVWRKK